MSGRICGWREHHGKLTAPAVWEPIIDKETWDRLQARLRDRSRAIGKQARFLLSGGLAVCECGNHLSGRRQERRRGLAEDGKGLRMYGCLKKPGRDWCGGVFRLAEPLEGFVREAVFTALDGPALTRALRASAKNNSREAELLLRIRKDEESLEQLARDHYAERIIGRAEFLAARQMLEAQVEQSKRQLAETERGALLADIPKGIDALRAAWDENALDWQRALLRTVLERVVVHKAVVGRNTFDPTKLELVWRA